MIQKFRYIFSRADKFKLVGLVVLMIIGSVLELLAVAVFNPFIEVMMQTSSIADIFAFLQYFSINEMYTVHSYKSSAISLPDSSLFDKKKIKLHSVQMSNTHF